jgi:hypothetical protein
MIMDSDQKTSNRRLTTSTVGIPLVFVLAASAQVMHRPIQEAASFDPGSLHHLIDQAAGNTVQDPSKPEGRAVVDPVTKMVQWFNWPNWNNWFNCFAGMWRNC